MLTTFQRSSSQGFISSKIEKKKQHMPKLTKLQKNFANHKPVNTLNRFLKSKVAEEGDDRHKTYAHFASKDLVRPLKRECVISTTMEYKPDDPLKWAMHCTKRCNDSLLFPKTQQYKPMLFFKGTNDGHTVKFIPTDHIGIRVPKIVNKTAGDDGGFLKMKEIYGIHSQTARGWSPRNDCRATATKSSVQYNIITGENDGGSRKKEDMFYRTLYNKKKSIAEISDLGRTYSTNFNHDYQNSIEGNKKIFHRFTGIFSNIYDAAWRNGNIYIPFRRNASDGAMNKAGMKI